MRPKSYSAVAWDTNSVSNISRKNALLAKVLKYQKEYAQRAVPHAQKLRPPIEVVVAHYRNK